MAYPTRRAATPVKVMSEMVDGNSRQQRAEPVGVEHALDHAKVGGGGLAPRHLLNDDAVAAGLDGRYQTHNQERRQERPELHARRQVQARPGREVRQVEPGRVENRLRVVKAEPGGDRAARNDADERRP